MLTHLVPAVTGTCPDHSSAPRSSVASLLRLVRMVVLAMLAVVCLSAPAFAEDTTWSIAPAPTDGKSGRDAESLSWELAPGSTVTDAVVVTNRTQKPLHLAVSAQDAETTADGHLDLTMPGHADSGVGSWVKVSRRAIDVPAGESVTVPFTLTVPRNAAPGDYAGGIATTFSGTGTTVVVDHRFASRVDVRVPGTATVSHAAAGLTASIPATWSLTSPSTATVTYTLTNTGSSRIYVQEQITTAGPLGLGSRATTATLTEVLPHARIRRTVAVPAWPLVRDDITVRTHAMGIDDAPGDVHTLETRATAISWSWLILAAVVLIGGIGGGVLLGRRRRASGPGAQAAGGTGSSRASRPSRTAGHSSTSTEK